MSRRRILVITLIAASSSLAACANSVTAPAEPMLTANTLKAVDGKAPTTCRGGWVSSAGRCE